MTPKDLNKYVAEQVALGKTPEAVANMLGITPECMYRKMAKYDEDHEEKTDSQK